MYFKSMKKIIIILFTLSFLFSTRGDLISVEQISTRTLGNNQIYIDNELSSTTTDQFSLEPVQYGYWYYKITYETVDKNNNYHVATGVLSFPRVDWPLTPNQAFPMISYQHGTAVERTSVSSQQNDIWLLPAFLSGSGYVYLEPDYLGLGDSSGMHPYQIKEPYGTCVVDLLRAAKQYDLQNDNFMINEQLFLVGYSEGGYATMAAHQIIERDYVDEFSITASLPMAGAYSMSEIMVDVMLSFESYGEPFYFPYVLFSYVDSYPEIGTIDNYLKEEYLFLEGMFDGYHSSAAINNVMPSIPATIMIPDSVTAFQNNDNHPLKIALRENDLWDWIPGSPMYIIHGIGDELVPYTNSELAYNQFLTNGAENVYLELLPESYGGHQDVAPWALLGGFNFAQDYKIICEMGDSSLDGMIDILDIVKTIDFIFDGLYHPISDLNNDNNINIFDITMLVEIIIYQ